MDTPYISVKIADQLNYVCNSAILKTMKCVFLTVISEIKEN